MVSESSWWASHRLLLAGVAICLTGAATAVLGTVSTFTSSQNKTQSVATGTFTFALANPGAGVSFTTNISGMAPGDFGDRLVDVSNTGSIALSSVALSATASTSTLLDTDAVNGLRLQIDNCSVAWTQASNAVAATCSGTTTALTASTPVATLIAGGPTYTSGLVALGSGTDHLRFHYALPGGSTGTAGLTSVLAYTFTATQAAGGAYH